MATTKSPTGHRQRLRERFLADEVRALPEESLAELLLTFAIPQKDVQPLAETLIQRFGSLKALLEASPEALRQVKGVGEATVVLLRLVARLAGQRPRRAAAKPKVEEWPLFPPEETDGPVALVPTTTDGQARQTSRKARQSRTATGAVRSAQRQTAVLFSNALLKEAIALAPRLPDTESLDEVRRFLRSTLHHSSEQTRERYAQYIARRLFPAGTADRSLRLFARKFAGTQSLSDVCFYRFMKAEPVVEQCVRDLLVPAVGRGTLPRATVRHYLAERFPDARPALVEDTERGIVQALDAAGLARTSGIRSRSAGGKSARNRSPSSCTASFIGRACMTSARLRPGHPSRHCSGGPTPWSVACTNCETGA